MSTSEDHAIIPLARPDISDEDIAEVVAALKSGWLTNGPCAARLEHDFAAQLGSGVHAVAVASATSGLQLALLGAGVGSGDEVITSAYTFTATAEAIYNTGARPVLVDVEPGGFNLDPARVAEAIGPRTRAVIPVHIAGQACRMDELLPLCEANRLSLIEDAAHALPARHGGALVGGLKSHAAVFSFYANKTVTTGEGGVVTTVNPDRARALRLASRHGIDRSAHQRQQQGDDRPWDYDVVCRGFKCGMSDVAAALALHQVGRVTARHERRVELASRYDAAFRELPLDLPPRSSLLDHAWHLYIVQLRPSARLSRAALLAALLDRGVTAGAHFKPLPLLTFWRRALDARRDDFPEAIRSWNRAVALPLFSAMSNWEQQHVIESVIDLLRP